LVGRGFFVIVLVLVVVVLESAFLPGIFKRPNPPRFSDVQNAGKKCLFEDEDEDEDDYENGRGLSWATARRVYRPYASIA